MCPSGIGILRQFCVDRWEHTVDKEPACAYVIQVGSSVFEVQVDRETWESYFLRMAFSVASRATCDRLHAGCVVAKDNRIISTGYNGSLPKADHCDNIGHLLHDEHCVRTAHAESNAIASAARMGVITDGACAYVTHTPCWNCIKVLVMAGIKQIYFVNVYESAQMTHPVGMEKILRQASVELIHYTE